MKKEIIYYIFRIIRVVALVYLIFEYYTTKEFVYLLLSIPFLIGLFNSYIKKFNTNKKI